MGDYRSLKFHVAIEGAVDEVKKLDLAEMKFNKSSFQEIIEFMHRINREDIDEFPKMCSKDLLWVIVSFSESLRFKSITKLIVEKLNSNNPYFETGFDSLFLTWRDKSNVLQGEEEPTEEPLSELAKIIGIAKGKRDKLKGKCDKLVQNRGLKIYR